MKGSVQYEHYEGTVLSKNQLAAREANGWTVADHYCNNDNVHRYVFRKMKEEQ